MEKDILEQLYHTYHRRLTLYALSLCRDPYLAEDLVQEAFLRAYLSLPEETPSFFWWMMRVLRNLLIDQKRRERFVSWEEAEMPTEGAEDAVLRQESVRSLYRGITALGEDDREILALYYFAQVSLRQIAQLLGLTEGAAKVRLYRARRRLKKRMEEDGYEI